MNIRVYYEDTDASGIVYHSKYINFCERARSEMLFRKDRSPFEKDGFFVVKSLNAHYIKSAKLGDILDVKTSLIKINKASLLLEQIILKSGVKVFEMEIKLAFVGFDGKIKKMSDGLTDDIKLIFDNY